MRAIQGRLLAAAVQVGMVVQLLLSGGPVFALAVQAAHITLLLLKVAGNVDSENFNPVVAQRMAAPVRRVIPGVQPLYLDTTTPEAVAVMAVQAATQLALLLEMLVTGVTVTNI
jgi:hypothetical protein